MDFGTLRLVSKGVKAEVERQESRVLDYMAGRGVHHLIRLCTEQAVDLASIEHYALLGQLKSFRMTMCETSPSPQVFAALLKLAPDLQSVTFFGPQLATDELLGELSVCPPTGLARIRLEEACIGLAGVRSLARLMQQVEELDFFTMKEEQEYWIHHFVAEGVASPTGGRLRCLCVTTGRLDRSRWSSRLVKHASEGIECLRLDRSDLMESEGTLPLGEALKATSSLRELSMERCSLTPQSLAALQLRHNRSITTLTLGYNKKLSPGSVAALLRDMPLLAVLDLTGNAQLGADPEQTFAYLRFASSLRELDLTRTGLRDEGLAVLQLNRHPSLVTITLRSNFITSHGLRALNCRDNTILRTLDFSRQRTGWCIPATAARHVFALPTQVILLEGRVIMVRGGQQEERGWRPFAGRINQLEDMFNGFLTNIRLDSEDLQLEAA